MGDYTVLPDRSAFCLMSYPLPQDHWLYAPPCQEWDEERDTTADTPHPILAHEQRAAVIAAVRYAIRGATMCGKEQDFDPDALVQNTVYALCWPVPLHDRVKSTELNEGADERWSYYYRVTECKAKTAQDGDCICWHAEGTGPFDMARHDDADQFLKWKESPNAQ